MASLEYAHYMNSDLKLCNACMLMVRFTATTAATGTANSSTVPFNN